MYSFSLGVPNYRQVVLMTTSSGYTFPDPTTFVKTKFDEIWPTCILFLTACAGVSLAIYFIKSLGK